MKINQRFRTRKDLRFHIVYFEMEGPLETSEVSAKIIDQLAEEKTEAELLKFVQDNYPDADAQAEVTEVLDTLKQLSLLSL